MKSSQMTSSSANDVTVPRPRSIAGPAHLRAPPPDHAIDLAHGHALRAPAGEPEACGRGIEGSDVTGEPPLGMELRQGDGGGYLLGGRGLLGRG